MAKQIEARLNELKFNQINLFMDGRYEDSRKAGWSISEFERQEEGNQPKIRLLLREHQKYGTNVIFFSIPPNETYRFATGSPVTEDNAMEIINKYMESAKKGEKFQF